MPSFEIQVPGNDADFYKTLALIKTEGYVGYRNQSEYQKIIEKLNGIKNKTNIQYSYIENLDFMTPEQYYFMPQSFAFLLLVLGEILYFGYMVFMARVLRDAFASWRIIHLSAFLFVIAFSVYVIIYRFITKIQNQALVLNIMRIRFIVIVELLIAFAIVVGCRIGRLYARRCEP